MLKTENPRNRYEDFSYGIESEFTAVNTAVNASLSVFRLLSVVHVNGVLNAYSWVLTTGKLTQELYALDLASLKLIISRCLSENYINIFSE